MRSPESAVAAALDLRAHGVLVGCFRPPSVPDGVSRLRVTARADLAGEDLFQAARLVARTAAAHEPASHADTVEGPRAGDAPSPARGFPSVAAVEGVQGPVPPSPLGAVPPHGDDD
jgi:8-amino-7-oxononanoate synthase